MIYSGFADVDASPSIEAGEASSRFYGPGGPAGVPGLLPPSPYLPQPGHQPYGVMPGGFPYPGNSIYPQSYPSVNNYYGGAGLGAGRPPALTPLGGGVGPYPSPVGQQNPYLNPYGPVGGAAGLYGSQYPGGAAQPPYLNNYYGAGAGVGGGYPYPSVGPQQPVSYSPQSSASYYPSAPYPTNSYNPSTSYPSSSYSPSYYPTNSYAPSVASSYPTHSGSYRPLAASSVPQTPYKPPSSSMPDPFSYDSGSSYNSNQGSSYPHGKPTIIELPASSSGQYGSTSTGSNKPYEVVILQTPSTSYKPSSASQNPYKPYSPSSSGSSLYSQSGAYRPVLQASIQELPNNDAPVYYPSYSNKPRDESKVSFPRD